MAQVDRQLSSEAARQIARPSCEFGGDLAAPETECRLQCPSNVGQRDRRVCIDFRLSEIHGRPGTPSPRRVSGPSRDAPKRHPGAAGSRRVVPWAVNQLFWKARHVYERLMKSGEALRKAQIAALKAAAAASRLTFSARPMRTERRWRKR